MRWHGIAYPGTYFLDASGIVTDKDFHQHHARRSSGATTLARALGRPVDPVDDLVTDVSDGDLEARVGIADQSLQLEVITTLAIDVVIPDGLHAYAPGAPEQYTPLAIDITAPGLRIGSPTWPDSTPLTMADLGQTVPTFEGTIRIEVPITATSEIIRLGHEIIQDTVDIEIAITAQLCDETACGLPQVLRAQLSAPLDRLVEPAGLQHYVQRVEQLEAETGTPVT